MAVCSVMTEVIMCVRCSMTIERFMVSFMERLSLKTPMKAKQIAERFDKHIKHAYNRIDWQSLEKEYDASCNWGLILNNLTEEIAIDIYRKAVKNGMKVI